jgi:hypothetical protein
MLERLAEQIADAQNLKGPTREEFMATIAEFVEAIENSDPEAEKKAGVPVETLRRVFGF